MSSGIKLEYPQGATPLDSNELGGLIPDYITTQGELNELERENVLEAQTWALRRPHTDFLNATFAFELHKRMFGRVWKWAGKQRRSEKNIGVRWPEITTELNNLFANTQYWLAHGTFDADGIAIRFHRTLVWIHPFVNGNGRHARLITEVLLVSSGREPFSWGRNASTDRIEAEGTLRENYIAALKEADRGDHDRLLRFARS